MDWSTMREFTTAAAATKDGETFGTNIKVVIDGREVEFLPATESQIALMISSGMTATTDQISATINFFFNIIADGRDADWLKGRLFRRDDPFGPENITDILQYLVEEWTGNPTQPLSGSTASPDSIGEPSTAAPPSQESTRFG